MSAAGWGGAFQGAAQGLAQLIAERRQQEEDATAKSRFDQQLALQKAQQAQQQAQFEATGQRADAQDAESARRFGIEQSSHNNQVGLEQMYRDAMLAKQPDPSQQHGWEMELERMRQGQETARAALARSTQLQAAQIAAGGRTTPQERFWDDYRGFQTRLGVAGAEPEEQNSQLFNFLRSGMGSGLFPMDQNKTSGFITPGIDPFVKANFGGDYGAAIKALGGGKDAKGQPTAGDPALLAGLIQKGLDPNVILGAVQKSLSDYTAKQRMAPPPSAPPPMMAPQVATPQAPAQTGNVYRQPGQPGGTPWADDFALLQGLAQKAQQWRQQNRQANGLPNN